MHPNDPFIASPILEEAIDRNPLIVSPDTPLIDAIALMSQARGSTCLLPELNVPSGSISNHEAHSSCVLVMEDRQLLGILTERDTVWLTADGTSFDGVTIGEVMSEPVITLPQSQFQDVFAALFLCCDTNSTFITPLQVKYNPFPLSPTWSKKSSAAHGV